MSVRRGYVNVSFGQVHYRYTGKRGAPILVLLHQTPSDSAMYEQLMLELRDDFRLIAPDTPGMGESDPLVVDFSMTAIAAGIAEFLDELGVEECVLFGHHTGASIAVELTANFPVEAQALVLSGPPLLDDELRDRLPALAASIPVTSDGAYLQAMWERIRGKDPSAPLEIIERETLSGIAIGARYGQAYDAVIEHDFERLLKKIRCPALVFSGTEDPLYSSVAATCALLADAESAEIAGARTFVCESHVAEVAGLIREFSAKVTA